MSADQSAGTLRGLVRDQDRAVISGAAVSIQHWEVERGSPRTLVSEPLIYVGSTGEYTAYLKPGVYDICVTYPGFSPAAKQVEVKSSKLSILNFELPLSPFVKLIQ